jgi:preprotein translocase subunit SecG
MIFILIVSVMLMLVVLVQSSKGGGLAGTFGGGDASMVFGVRRTADFLIKITAGLAVIYMVFSLVTNVIINQGTGTRESIIQQNNQQNFPQQQVPQQQMPDQQQPNQQDDGQPPQDNQQPPK